MKTRRIEDIIQKLKIKQPTKLIMIAVKKVGSPVITETD